MHPVVRFAPEADVSQMWFTLCLSPQVRQRLFMREARSQPPLFGEATREKSS